MENEVKVWEGVEAMSRKKMDRRRQLAKLPLEKKIAILKQLQRIASEISTVSGRKRRKVWG